MKIFLPFKVKDIGGTSTFARKFKEGMEAAGHEVSYEYSSDYDVLFLIVQCPLTYLLDAKKNGKKIVQRLDGTYYWTVSGPKFLLLNAKAAYIRHFFADFTIYQSQYSQECANRFLGRKKHDKHAIIYNGIDLNLFSPRGDTLDLRENPRQKIFFTASAFRRADQIAPIIDGLNEYANKYDRNFKFVIAGTFVNRVQLLGAQLKKIGYIKLIGKIGNKELPAYERSSDVFLFSHLNPPCPNNIIEALGCALPIVGVADGAMSEIVTDDKGGLLIPARGTGFWTRRHFDASAFADNLHQLLQDRNKYSQQARQIAEERFSLKGMISEYLNVFKGLIE